MGFSFSRLYRASIFGSVEVVSALMKMKDYDVNGRDFGGTYSSFMGCLEGA